MKTLLTALTLSLMTVTATPALARSIMLPVVSTAELVTLNIDPELKAGEVVGGSVSIDHSREKVRLMLFRRSNCPAGAMCIAMIPAPLIIDLPLVDVRTLRNGTVIYTAELDRRPVDGNYELIEIRDRSATPPPANVRQLPTVIKYETKASGFGGFHLETTSTFGARKLETRRGF